MRADLFGYLGFSYNRLTKVIGSLIDSAPYVQVQEISNEVYDIEKYCILDLISKDTCKVLQDILKEANFNCDYTMQMIKECYRTNKYSRHVLLCNLIVEIRSGYIVQYSHFKRGEVN